MIRPNFLTEIDDNFTPTPGPAFLLSCNGKPFSEAPSCQKSPNTRPGSPSWADLLSHDGQTAKDFYTALFGWEYVDHPAGPDMVYTMYTHNGLAACASAEAGPGQENLPPHWSVYVTVDDLEATVERAKAAGGTVVAEPFDVFDAGRMAIIRDKEGAFLRLWHPGAHAGAGTMHEPGALTWFELATTDPESAGAFYDRVLGTQTIPDPDQPEFPYWLIQVDGEPRRRHHPDWRGLGAGAAQLGRLFRRQRRGCHGGKSPGTWRRRGGGTARHRRLCPLRRPPRCRGRRCLNVIRLNEWQ